MNIKINQLHFHLSFRNAESFCYKINIELSRNVYQTYGSLLVFTNCQEACPSNFAFIMSRPLDGYSTAADYAKLVEDFVTAAGLDVDEFIMKVLFPSQEKVLSFSNWSLLQT